MDRDDDPLSRALAPPQGETPEEADIRIRLEKEAIKVSEDIDRTLRQEVQNTRRTKCVKILLLGQSESDFQRKYDPNAFDKERAVWRSVCQLNVVRSFGIILDVLNRHDFPSHLTPPTSPHEADESTDTDIDNIDTQQSFPSSSYQIDRESDSSNNLPTLSPEHRRLMMRLGPLRQLETVLTKRFKPLALPNTPISPPRSPVALANILSPSQSHDELRVNGYSWKRARETSSSDGDRTTEDDESLARVLSACKEDMIQLWNDPLVRRILKEYRVGMEEVSKYFLDELERVAVPNFKPTDDDILRARLKTLGVTEHVFSVRPRFLERGEHAPTTEFRIYDVGGSRSQRHAWMPFFDDVNAIVFLAPMSAFDQTLAEAPEVNRLEDTFKLWKIICSSPLLTSVSFVLLLNKVDILQQKIDSGVRFGRYVKSYTGKNNWENVAKYLKTKFKAVQRELSPAPRLFYAHITCATDTQQMIVILAAIEDLVLRRNLEQINLL
ncbi:hypothetical protein Clacol_010195 [Clathrus columnatus]|uniref:G-alpha-domain-containing protein n=1 Tax=Clathrus columnatus TaxID=1419009 RepID=A0AAV5AMP0_9AGAM|nr:hypothetical protein Clacol_010195 [Clathrus columnatus]